MSFSRRSVGCYWNGTISDPFTRQFGGRYKLERHANNEKGYQLGRSCQSIHAYLYTTGHAEFIAKTNRERKREMTPRLWSSSDLIVWLRFASPHISSKRSWGNLCLESYRHPHIWPILRATINTSPRILWAVYSLLLFFFSQRVVAETICFCFPLWLLQNFSLVITGRSLAEEN